jgi:hypothetical protein
MSIRLHKTDRRRRPSGPAKSLAMPAAPRLPWRRKDGLNPPRMSGSAQASPLPRWIRSRWSLSVTYAEVISLCVSRFLLSIEFSIVYAVQTIGVLLHILPSVRLWAGSDCRLQSGEQSEDRRCDSVSWMWLRYPASSPRARVGPDQFILLIKISY